MPPIKPEHVGLTDPRDSGWRGAVSEVGKQKPPRDWEEGDPRRQPVRVPGVRKYKMQDKAAPSG
jgi:hypothetical protein